MSHKEYTDEYKAEAIKQVTERGHSAHEVAKRLGMSGDTLYRWVRESRKAPVQPIKERSQSDEIARLRAELKRVTEERDILKKAAAYFAKGFR
jgi:transposase